MPRPPPAWDPQGQAEGALGRLALLGVAEEGGGGGQPGGGGGTVPPARARSFHGTVEVSATLAKSRLNTIAEEVIALLVSDPNATVRITLEVDAEFPHGASDAIKRGVSEDAASLGFKAKDWE